MSRKREKPELVSVNFTGDIFNNRQWLVNQLETVRSDLIMKHPYQDRMVILQEDVRFEILYSNPKIKIVAYAKAGYAFDYASVPKLFGRIVDYDDPNLARGAFVHDICFNHSLGGLDFSADLLRDIAVYFGYDKRKSRLVHWAVKTNIAKIMYRNRDAFDVENCKYSGISMEA